MDDTNLTKKWFLCGKPRAQPALRLFCFTHAGGGATTYHRWNKMLGEQIEIQSAQLPARENRAKENAVESIAQAVEVLCTAIKPLLNQNYAVFGHSMGALIAYEVCRSLQASGARSPLGLFVSGRRSPDIGESSEPLHLLSDSEFVSAVQQRYGGIPEIILKDPDFLSYFIGPMRADFKILETYAYEEGPRLDVPLEVYYGREDKALSREKIEGWKNMTSCTTRISDFSGGHFFLHDHAEDFLPSLKRDLESLLAK